MLELIILFLLTRSVKRIAEAKELNPTKYVTYTILLWFGFEALFYVLGLIFFRVPLLAYFFALMGAAIGGLLAYRKVKNADQGWTKFEEVE